MDYLNLKKVYSLGLIPVVHADASWVPTNVSSTSLPQLIQTVLNLLLVAIVIAAVVYLILNGLKYISSQGEAGKAQEAQKGITNALIGLVVAFSAYVLVSFVLSRLNVTPGDITMLPALLSSIA